MPRDSGGTYTLPVSNPVTSGTIITSTWANATMPDLGSALTDSLSRTGNGAMLTALKHVDGGVGTPSITFNNEPTTGAYRAGTNDVRITIAGSDVFKITPAGVFVWDTGLAAFSQIFGGTTLELADQAEALAHTENTKAMSSLRTFESYSQYGLGAGGPSTQNLDLNTAQLGSFISAWGVDNDAAANNWPVLGVGASAVWWNVHTFGAASTRISQIAYQVYSAPTEVMYTRTKHDATWSPWRLVWSDLNLADPLDKAEAAQQTIGGNLSIGSLVSGTEGGQLDFWSPTSPPFTASYIDLVSTGFRFITNDGAGAKVMSVPNVTGAIATVTLGSNGNGYYRKFSDGTVEQWGSAAIAGNSALVVTLPIALSVAAENVQVTSQNFNSAAQYSELSGWTVTGSLTQLSLWLNAEGGHTVNWMLRGKY